MRLLICAGGTGGGVYPALAVLQELDSNMEKVLWVGSQGGLEADIIQRAGIPYLEIPAAGVHGIARNQLPKNLMKLLRGFFASRRILSEFRPDCLFFTGGYLAIPMAFAALGYPKVVYVPDIEPGLALKVLARVANEIAVTVEEAKKYLPCGKNILVTGYPTRRELANWNREKAREWIGLSHDMPVLLVVGGSRGARSINLAVLENLKKILEFTQVIHISGKLDWELVQKVRPSLSENLQKRYHAFEYLHEMGAALAAADLVVSRAGASILGEYPKFGLPAVLIPYPYAWRYQILNADHLQERKSAVVVRDENLKQELLPVIQSVLNNPEKLSAMRSAMASLSNPDAAKNIGRLIIKIGRPGTKKAEITRG